MYEGQWSKNRRHGRGRHVWPGGAELRCEFRAGEPEGPGVFTLPDGTVFRGSYRAGLIHDGAGVRIYDDGTRYAGQWRDGRREGIGVLFDDHWNAIQGGLWRDDEYAGPVAEGGGRRGP